MNPTVPVLDSDPIPGPTPRPPRLAAVDLARGLAVLFMIAVHILLVHGDTALQSSFVGKIIQFLGGPPAAPIFMLLMGLSFAYAGKNEPGVTVRRGLIVLASGYLLNFLRGVLPLLVLGWFAPAATEGILPVGVGLTDLFLIGDILQFAGLALVAMALIHRMRAGSGAILIIATVVAGIAPFLWGLRSGFAPLDLVLDLLWGDRLLPPPMENAISFPVFPWLAFPLVGMVLGERLRNAADPRSDIRRAGLIGLALLAVGLGISFTDPEWHFNDYYHARWGSMIFMVGFVLVWLAACDLVARGMPENPAFRFLAFCSKQVTAIYFLQWILINWAIAILGENRLGPAAAFGMFLVVTLASYAGAACSLALRRSRHPVSP